MELMLNRHQCNEDGDAQNAWEKSHGISLASARSLPSSKHDLQCPLPSLAPRAASGATNIVSGMGRLQRRRSFVIAKTAARMETFANMITGPFAVIRAIRFLFVGPLILAFLFVINLMTSPGHWWIQWPTLGIGIAWIICLFRVLKAVLIVGGLAALISALRRR
jgi:hypothetical protein